MQSWFSRLWAQLASTASVVALVIGVVAVREVREWFLDHAALGWYTAAVLLLAIITLTTLLTGGRDQDARPTKIEPTQRDRDTWASLRALLDWESRTMSFVQERFTGKQWFDQDVDDLYCIADRWKNRTFDDPACNTEWRHLYDAVRSFVDWLGTKGSPDPNQPSRIEIKPVRYRKGGYNEFEKERYEGADLARRIPEAWRALETAANRARLYQQSKEGADTSQHA